MIHRFTGTSAGAADAIRDRLRDDFSVTIDDRAREWSCSGAPADSFLVLDDAGADVASSPAPDAPRGVETVIHWQ